MLFSLGFGKKRQKYVVPNRNWVKRDDDFLSIYNA